jgi:hypothetical protein
MPDLSLESLSHAPAGREDDWHKCEPAQIAYSFVPPDFLILFIPAFTLRNDWLQPLRAEWLLELGSTMPTSKAILAPVCGLPHTCPSVNRSELPCLPT